MVAFGFCSGGFSGILGDRGFSDAATDAARWEFCSALWRYAITFEANRSRP